LYDVVIVGAGPAGLSAALTLGRCCRRVLVCDAGQPRNAASHALHCFLTRDGVEPTEFLRIGREQLRPYDSVTLQEVEVADAIPVGEGFEVSLGDGTQHRCRKLLLATGVVDQVPNIVGIERLYGRSVHPCPYCDGWEWHDQPLAVYGRGEKGCGLALMLTLWSTDLVLCTDGPADLSGEQCTQLARHNIAVHEQPIARLEGTADGLLERIILTSGEALVRRALFFNTGQHQCSPLAAKLSCELTDKGGVATGEYEVTTNVPGLYIAGDASRDVQLVIIAAAEGAKAAFAINKALLHEAGLE
jgi:thioredoxin reductase